MKHFLITLLALLPTCACAQIPDCSQGTCAGMGAPTIACHPGNKYAQMDSAGTNWTCTGIPPSWVRDAGGSGGGNSVTLENVYSAPGSFTFATALNSVFPQVTCYTRVGGGYGPATVTAAPIDANDTSITVPSAGDYICSFNSSGTLIPPAGDFSVAVSPTSKTFEPTMQGTQSPTFTVNQSITGSYSGTATYTSSGLASGMTGVYSPTTITGAGSNTLTVSFPFSQTPATTSFTVQGSDGTHTHTANPSLTVGNINSGLVDCWPMTDGTGSALADGCSTSNAALLFTGGFTWQTNYTLPGTTLLNSNAYFVGSNQTATNFTGATAFSISTWVGSSNFAAGSQAIISTLNPAASFIGWELETDAGGHPHGFLVNTYPSNAIETASTAVLSAGLHYVVVTYDGSKTAAGVKFYIDGVLGTNGTPTADTLTGSIANTLPVTILARNNGTDAFIGVEAFTRLYNRALSQADITNYFTAGPR